KVERCANRFKALLCVIFSCSNFVILIAFMVYHFRTKPIALDALNGALQRYADIMEGRPIMDITLSSVNSCPTGYELLSLGIWDGTKKGCWKKEKLMVGACGKGGG